MLLVTELLVLLTVASANGKGSTSQSAYCQFQPGAENKSCLLQTTVKQNGSNAKMLLPVESAPHAGASALEQNNDRGNSSVSMIARMQDLESMMQKKADIHSVPTKADLQKIRESGKLDIAVEAPTEPPCRQSSNKGLASTALEGNLSQAMIGINDTLNDTATLQSVMGKVMLGNRLHATGRQMRLIALLTLLVCGLMTLVLCFNNNGGFTCPVAEPEKPQLPSDISLCPPGAAPHSTTPWGTRVPGTKLFAAALIAMSAVAFSAMSLLMNASSYDENGMQYAAVTCFRFTLPWLACSTGLTLSGEKPWAHFFDRDVLVRTMLNVVAALLEAATLAQLQLVDATILMFMHPFPAALLGAKLLGEDWTYRRSGLLTMGFCGVVLACAPWDTSERDRSPLTQPMGLACGFGYALTVASMNIWTRSRTSKTNALLLTHHYLFVGMLVSVIMLVWTAGHKSIHILEDQAKQHTISVLGVALTVVVGEVACTKGFQLSDVGSLSCLRNIDIVLVFVWQAMFLQQAISTWSILGAATVIISTYMLVMPWLTAE